MSGRLYVDFCGEERVLEPGEQLSVGRAADLRIDDNPYLHRVLARFGSTDEHWWVHNCGAAIPLNLFDRGSPSSAVVAPGATAALTMAEFGLAFVAGRTRYELDGALEQVPDPPDPGAPEGADRTLDWGVVELNADQRLLLVDLAADRLRLPSRRDVELPAKAACARRLGWSLSKYNRKLDHLCAKLDRAGVTGLCGEAGAQAADRRRRLVDHAVDVGLVTADDLDLLAPGRPPA